MSLTPVELRHVKPARGMGYRKEAVDKLLSEVAASFEGVWRDRADLADRLETLEHDLGRYREMETILRSTLVSAETAAADLRERARREAQLILDEAHSEARTIAREAQREHEQLIAEGRRVRALLAAALATVEEATGERRSAPAAHSEPTFASSPAGSLLDDTAEHVLPADGPLSPGFRAA